MPETKSYPQSQRCALSGLINEQLGQVFEIVRVVRPSQKQNTLPDHTPPEKASECSVRQRLCQRCAMDYAYPGSMLATPEGT